MPVQQPLISFFDGVAVIRHHGQPVPEAAYSDYITWTPEYDERIKEFAGNGVRVLAWFNGSRLGNSLENRQPLNSEPMNLEPCPGFSPRTASGRNRPLLGL